MTLNGSYTAYIMLVSDRHNKVAHRVIHIFLSIISFIPMTAGKTGVMPVIVTLPVQFRQRANNIIE